MNARLLRAAVLASAALLITAVQPPSAQAATASPSPSTGATAASPAPANDAAKVTFGVGASTKGVLDQRQGISLVQARGTTVRDEVTVVNLSPTPLTLDVYAVDVHNDVNGHLEPDVAATKAADAGAWVTMETPGGARTVVVPGRGHLVVPVVVHIPKNAPIGDHLAGLMVSLTSKSTSSGAKNAQINLDQRVGIRLAVRVAGPVTAQLSVKDVQATYTGTLVPIGRGTAQVTYTVTNTGTVKLGGHQTVAVTGLFGEAAATTSPPDLPVLLPGGSATVTVQVPDVIPMGLLSANVSVLPLPAQGDADPALTVATGSVRFWAIPWTLLALLLILIGILGLIIRRRRRRPEVAPGRRERDSAAAAGLVSASQSSEQR